MIDAKAPIRSFFSALVATKLLGIALIVCGAPTVAAANDPVATTRTMLQRAAQLAQARPQPKTIARATLLRQPGILGVQLAPDGRHLSFLRRDNELRDAVWLQDVATGKQHRVVSDITDVDLAWSGDGRQLWLADAQGLAVIDTDTRAAKRIMQWDRRRAQRLWRVDPRTPRHAIVLEHVPAETTAPFRYLLVDSNGKQRVLHAARWPLRSATLNHNGRLAFAAAYDGERYDTVIRRYSGDRVQELMRCTGIERCDVLAQDDAQQTLWLLSQHGEERTALMRWRVQDGRMATVHRDPLGIADADAALLDRDASDWLGIAYNGARRHWHGRDPAIAAQIEAMQRHLPDANLALGRASDNSVWLVRAEQSNWPFDRHFLYTPKQERWQELFAGEDIPAQASASADLVSAVPVTWRASDGMLLHGYAYLPDGVALAKAPLIAWLHGGPIARSDDDYDSRIQTLVNRGYVVFAPNFRASSGYGLAYTAAAQGDVGNGRVLKDVIEGLDFVLGQGIGDRTRQAVAGHSFGGYASLLAVSHHPDRFRFAFAGAPPTDYGWMKQWQADHDSEAIRADGPPLAIQFAWHRISPDDAAWRERMRRESPLAALPHLRTPIYLWAGGKDQNVPLTSIAFYAAEATRLEKQITLLIDPNAAHAPREALAAEAWMALLERAADQHFGGGTTPFSSSLATFLSKNLRIDGARLLEFNGPRAADAQRAQ